MPIVPRFCDQIRTVPVKFDNVNQLKTVGSILSQNTIFDSSFRIKKYIKIIMTKRERLKYFRK